MIKKVLTASTLGSLMGLQVFAAADEDVLGAGATMAQTIQDNVMGVLSANLPVIILAGVFILSVTVIWRMGKRFVR